MQQKTSVVASLVHSPDILFLDEPTVGLDPTTKRVLWDLMVDLNEEGRTIILCSHDMYEVDKICDNINIIDSGKVVANDTPQGLKDQLLSNIEENNKQIRESIFKLEQEGIDENKEQINGLKSSLTLENLDVVQEVTTLGNTRLNISLKRSETSVNEVISTLVKYGGNIASIKTNDPTLEDVFVAITAKSRRRINDGK